MSNKTVMITLDFPPNRGGVARYLSHLAAYFSDRLFVIAPPIDEPDSHYPFVLVRQPLLFSFIWPRWIRSIWILWKKRKEYNQVLVSHLLPLGTAAWIISFIIHKPYLVILHGMDIRLALHHPFKHFLARAILSRAKCVIVNSQALAQEVQRHFYVQHLEVVYPCVDPVFLVETSRTISSDPSVLRLITVSRLVPRKGHGFVLEALKRLRKEGIQSLTYDIYGDGPEATSLRKFVTAEHLEDIVHFYPQATDEQILAAYRQSDLFVMPVLDDQKDKEGFGMVYIEAASQGLPAIATRISGVDEAVLDQETGVLIPSGDVEALCTVIKDFLSHPEKRQAMGERAKQRACREYIAAKQFKKLEPFL